MGAMQKRMNWQAVSFDWNHIRAFLAVVEEGSFTAAARALGVSQPTLGRQLGALERDLGVALFERTGRDQHLTEAGMDLLEHVRVMGQAAGALSLAAAGRGRDLHGEVCITASDVACAFVLPPIVRTIQRAAPDLRIRLIASSREEDLRRRDADIALRHVQPAHQELIARRLADWPAQLYASSEWLTRHGRPRTRRDVERLPFVGYADTQRLIRAAASLGVNISKQNFRITTSSGAVGWDLVRQGFGVGLMATSVARATPDVEPVLEDLPAVRVPAWLVTHRELRTSERIRLVFDSLAAALR